MPVDITKDLYIKFQSEVGQEQVMGAPPGRTERREAKELRSAVGWTMSRAMAAADSSFGLCEHAGLGVLSAEDCSNYVLHRQEVGILSPQACRKRQIEFASGRAAARFALHGIGVENHLPILRG